MVTVAVVAGYCATSIDICDDVGDSSAVDDADADVVADNEFNFELVFLNSF